MKKRNLKAIAAVLLGTLMVTSLTACGSSNSNSNGSSDNGSSTPTETSTTGDSKDIVTIKWVAVGNGMPDNYDAWQANINEYLEDKIGVDLDMEIVSWGDWDNRRSAIVNTNEDYDILFTNQATYASDVRLGAFYDLSGSIINNTADLYNSIPAEYWDAVKINGSIYAVPSYKDSSATQYFVWDKDLADKYNIDYKSLNTLDSLTDALTTLKSGENAAPVILDVNGIGAIMSKGYDAMSLGLPALGVKYGDDTKKVVSVFEQDDIMKDLKTLNEWYNEGIINSDAAILAEAPTYKPFSIAQGWSLAAKTTWGPNMGVNAEAVQWGNTVVSNDTVCGSLNCISASSKNPEKALELLQLVNTDSHVRDALYYGLEGDNFEYTADGKVNKLNDDWKMAGYTQGSFFNVSQLADSEVNQWDEVKELNEKATASPVLGIYVDTTEFEDELANCIEIYNRYKSELLTGTKEAEAEVASMMSEMKDAGFDTIVQKVQEQIDSQTNN